MAKNWNVKMSVEALNGTHEARKEFVNDAGKRFPNTVTALVTLHALTAASVTGSEAFTNIFNAVPEYTTLRKLESVLKSEVDDTEEEPVIKEKKVKEEKIVPIKEKKAKKVAKVEEEDEEESEDVFDTFEEDEEDEPVKATKKPGKIKKEEKKSKKKVTEDDDEDDDWE